MRKLGAAYRSRNFLFEPLTPALHLYCTNNATHMETLAKCVCAIRSTVFKLAELHQKLQMQPAPVSCKPSLDLPYFFATNYPDAIVQQIFPSGRLLFLLTPKGAPKPRVKFVASSDQGSSLWFRSAASLGCNSLSCQTGE